MAWHGKTMQGKASEGKARHGMEMKGMEWNVMTRQGKAWCDKARKDI